MLASYIYGVWTENGGMELYGPYVVDVADARKFFHYRPKNCFFIRVHVTNDLADPADRERKVYVWQPSKGWHPEEPVLASLDNRTVLRYLSSDWDFVTENS